MVEEAQALNLAEVGAEIAATHPGVPVEVFCTDEHRLGLKPVLHSVWALQGQSLTAARAPSLPVALHNRLRVLGHGRDRLVPVQRRQNEHFAYKACQPGVTHASKVYPSVRYLPHEVDSKSLIGLCLSRKDAITRTPCRSRASASGSWRVRAMSDFNDRDVLGREGLSKDEVCHVAGSGMTTLCELLKSGECPPARWDGGPSSSGPISWRGWTPSPG